jgi:hypothetical protein
VAIPAVAGIGTYDTGQFSVTPDQLGDINALAPDGGTLTVLIDSLGTGWTASLFTLNLVGTTEFGLPEGGYPPSFPSAHAYQPNLVLQDSDWVGGPLLCHSLAPVSLVGIVLPDGAFPPWSAGFEFGLQPNQDTTFSASDLMSVGALEPEGVYRLWFAFNDAPSTGFDHAGSLAVTASIYAEVTMADPLVSLLRPQFGPESGYGGSATVARVLNCIENSGFDLNPEQTKASAGIAGIGFDTREDLTTEMSKGSIKGIWEYRDFGFLLNSQYGGGSSSNPTAGVYQWTWEDNAYANNVPQTYAFEMPTASGERAQSVNKLFFDSIKLDTERDKEISISANVMAGVISDGITPTAGSNSVQVVTVNGSPTGGTFELICDNVPTAGIAYNAAASAVQSAIRALNGDWMSVTVSGSGPYTITIPTGKPEPLIQANYAGLTGGTSPTVTVAMTTAGGMAIHASDRVLPNQISAAFAADLTTLVNSPTVLTDLFATSLDLGERYGVVWRQNTSDTGPGLVAQKKASDIKDTVTLTVAYNAQVGTFISNSRSGTRMYVRVSAVGPQIASSGYYLTYYYDVSGMVTWKANKDSQGNIRSVDFEVAAKFDTATGFRSRWTCINDVASYAA